jgi:HK97 family phage prohead protease
VRTDKASRATAAGSKERRAYPTKFEIRGKTGSSVNIEAYASVYEEPYEMFDWYGDYTEVVRQGAGSKTLSESPQVQWLENHSGLSMAYTKAGTLKLSEDSTGLHWAATANMNRTDVRDLVTAVEDGDVDECSFAFRCIRQTWSPDYDQRDILEYSLHRGDVSIVNFGANPATAGTPALRGQDVDQLDERTARALLARLAVRFPTEPDREADEEPTDVTPDLTSLYRAKARLLLVGR